MSHVLLFGSLFFLNFTLGVLDLYSTSWKNKDFYNLKIKLTSCRGQNSIPQRCHQSQIPKWVREGSGWSLQYHKSHEKSGLCLTIVIAQLQVTEINWDKQMEKEGVQWNEIGKLQKYEEIVKNKNIGEEGMKASSGSWHLSSRVFSPRSSSICLSPMYPTFLYTPNSWDWVSHGPSLVSCLAPGQWWQDILEHSLSSWKPPVDVITENWEVTPRDVLGINLLRIEWCLIWASVGNKPWI